MKKTLLLLLLLLTSLATYAYNFEVDGIYYNITSEDDKTVEVTYGDSYYEGDIVLPEKVSYSNTEYTVTAIGGSAFYKCTSLASIELPSSLASIGGYAFYDCTSLASIELPSTLTEIGDLAFYRCTSLANIEFPASLTTIGSLAFARCTSLQNVTIPSNTSLSDGGSFGGCSSMTEINVSSENPYYVSVDGILYSKDLTTIICYPGGKEFNLPENVTIGAYAFSYREDLTSLELPSSITSIEEAAFSECANLTKVKLPENITTIAAFTFFRCYSLESVEIPESVTNIDRFAFCACSSLQEVKLPNSLQTLGEFAFCNTSLSKIDIPATVNYISTYNSGTFDNCMSLTEINVDEANETYASVDGVLLNKEKTVILFCPQDRSEGYTIPSTVTKIGFGGFYKCKSLPSITFNDKVEILEEDAFWGCSALTEVTLPASVKELGATAFGGCSAITKFTCLNPEPPTYGSGALYRYISTVYVPNEAVEAYQNADGWNKFNIVGIDVTDITGVSDIVANGNVNGSVDCYTLQGVRVKTVRAAEDIKSLRPGLYIVNGKKIVVR